MIQRCIDLLVDSFPDDPSSPSVVLSRLAEGYYGSLVRYEKAFGQGRQVLYKCCHPTLEEVFADLLRQLGANDGEQRS